jgi:hypothetical protein
MSVSFCHQYRLEASSHQDGYGWLFIFAVFLNFEGLRRPAIAGTGIVLEFVSSLTVCAGVDFARKAAA